MSQYPSLADRQYTRHTLAWLLSARKKLSSAELLAAVSIAVPSRRQLTINQILDLCCNLVVLDSELDTFRFAHLSVREFLEKQGEFANDRSNALAAESCLLSMIGSANDQASKYLLSELGYLSNCGYEQLQPYSYRFWAPHCQAAAGERQKGRLQNLLTGFIQDKVTKQSAFSMWTIYLESLQWDGDSELYQRLQACRARHPTWMFVTCAFDIYEVVMRGMTDVVRTHLRNVNNETVQEVAAKYGSYNALSILISIDYTAITKDVVKAAAGNKENRKEVIALLLDRCGDQITITEEVVEATADNKENRKEVITLLLDRCRD